VGQKRFVQEAYYAKIDTYSPTKKPDNIQEANIFQMPNVRAHIYKPLSPWSSCLQSFTSIIAYRLICNLLFYHLKFICNPEIFAIVDSPSSTPLHWSSTLRHPSTSNSTIINFLQTLLSLLLLACSKSPIYVVINFTTSIVYMLSNVHCPLFGFWLCIVHSISTIYHLVAFKHLLSIGFQLLTTHLHMACILPPTLVAH